MQIIFRTNVEVLFSPFFLSWWRVAPICITSSLHLSDSNSRLISRKAHNPNGSMAKGALRANLHKTPNFQVMNDVARPPPPTRSFCRNNLRAWGTTPPCFRKMGILFFVFFKWYKKCWKWTNMAKMGQNGPNRTRYNNLRLKHTFFWSTNFVP